MARNGIYAQGQYGQLDRDFCALMAEIVAWDARANVRKSAAVVALYALTCCWPASHYPKRERDKWPHKAKAAFRVSERELAEATGFSRPRVHRALENLLGAGFVVLLAPAKPWGEGRGTAPAIYAFRCHVGTQKVGSAPIGSESPDQSSPAQPWDLQGA